MDYFTPDQYYRARHASLIGYIQSRGYPLKRHGHELLLVHPQTQTTTIRSNSWYQRLDGPRSDLRPLSSFILRIPRYVLRTSG